MSRAPVRCLSEPGVAVRDTGRVANGGTGILTAGTQGGATPAEARRAWPQWLALGIAMIAVAVTPSSGTPPAPGCCSVRWGSSSSSAVRCCCAARGPARSARRWPPGHGAWARARVAVGAAGLTVAVASGVLAARVLLVAVPVVLLVAAVGAAGAWRGRPAWRTGAARLDRPGHRPADRHRCRAGLGARVRRRHRRRGAGDGRPRRAAASSPRPGSARSRPSRSRPPAAVPAACAGCACGAGGCGALG